MAARKNALHAKYHFLQGKTQRVFTAAPKMTASQHGWTGLAGQNAS
ncbi:MAG: hypothetical protein P4L42_00660 [Desulfocapsaceae bacterium]|nr:hypothetical protein [Desulfocapsaceae bacterium]